MIYLILSVLISSSLYVIFKLFDVFKVNTFQAIVMNYIVAFVIGYGYSDVKMPLSVIPQQNWFYGALVLGFLFITIFNVMATTSQRNGLSVASVSGRMAVVIPIVFGIVVYNESVSVVKVIGIVLALLAVYLTSVKSNKTKKFEASSLVLPIILFLGSGAIDTLLKYTELNFVSAENVSIFSASIFGIAFIFGLLFLLIEVVRKNIKLEMKSFVGGIALGIPNYFSIEFLIRALKIKGIESSVLFTINNVSIVLLTTLFGLFLFKEKLENKNWLGVIIAIVSIILITVV
ncbi:EamA-like transporter family protein [Tenacibaculum skagerrakense]|uniref:EamA-like transporter family protein n=1 Tax=Tenacibaculum skagerrakense TaxID=186571 RepID=A0A4R2NW46_9FLAO|nr:EamA family transporter [Tenacibaculum skagerrakense]TCP25821.1 EamA-like transporter family protein [Tenacibaculum skagerrakense]